MAWVAVGVAAVGIISGGMQAQTTLEQGETQKMIDNMNADFLEVDEAHALQMGQTESARYATQITQTVGTQRQQEAAAGVDVNFGTAKELQTETQVTGLLNQLDLQQAARNKAYGLENQALNMRLTGSNAMSQATADASSQQTTALIQGGGMIANGVEKEYGGQKPGGGGVTGYSGGQTAGDSYTDYSGLA